MADDNYFAPLSRRAKTGRVATVGALMPSSSLGIGRIGALPRLTQPQVVVRPGETDASGVRPGTYADSLEAGASAEARDTPVVRTDPVSQRSVFSGLRPPGAGGATPPAPATSGLHRLHVPTGSPSEAVVVSDSAVVPPTPVSPLDPVVPAAQSDVVAQPEAGGADDFDMLDAIEAFAEDQGGAQSIEQAGTMVASSRGGSGFSEAEASPADALDFLGVDGASFDAAPSRESVETAWPRADRADRAVPSEVQVHADAGLRAPSGPVPAVASSDADAAMRALDDLVDDGPAAPPLKGGVDHGGVQGNTTDLLRDGGTTSHHPSAQAGSAPDASAASYRMPGAGSFATTNLRRPVAPAPVQPREYEEPKTAFSGLQQRPGMVSTSERSARRDVNAVKVVTRLVRAMAHNPGSSASDDVKRAELERLLGEVHRGASAIAMASAPLDAHRPWVQAMCAEAMAEMVAARVERDTYDEPLDLDLAIRTVVEVFERNGGGGDGAPTSSTLVSDAIASLEGSKYVEATNEAIAADKVAASARLAAWDLFDHVTDPRVGADKPVGFRYTYDHEPHEIVAFLLDAAVGIAREANVRSSNLDVRTMHMQGSIRRVASLIGSEYIKRTRAIMNWCIESDGEEYVRRCAEARDTMKTVTLVQVVELARRSFQAIEAIAPKLVESSKQSQVNQERQHGK